MEHLKHFFKQKGLYLACLAVVFAATAAGVLALRSVLNHVVELTGTAQEETPWQDDTTVNKPDTTQPEPVRTPAPVSSASPSSDAASGVPAASPAPAASAAPSGAAAKSSDFWQGKVLAPYSGDELVYNATLGDWRTHNGVDTAAAAGDEVPAVRAGRVAVVEDDALWGGVVEIVDANGCTWRYCGVTPGCVVGGDVTAGDVIGYMGHTGYSTQENVNNIEVTHLHWGLQLIFDESQKEGNNEIWIDVYPLTRFLAKHTQPAAKVEGTKEWKRTIRIIDPAVEEYLQEQ